MKKVTIYSSGLVLLLISFFLINYCSREDNLLVARVGGRTIMLTEFESEFTKGKNSDMIVKSSPDDKRNFLNRLIDRNLKIIDAYRHQLDKDEQIIDQVKQNSRRFMFDRLVELEVIQKVVPESELKDYFDKSNREVKIRQIVVKFDPKNVEQKESAYQRAKEIVRRLKYRESFSQLAADVSEDINTAKKGGDKGYLKWGPKSFENPIYVAAFSMKKDEISDPIETENGYFIINVVDIKEYPKYSFEQEREKIRRTIYSIRNNEITEAYYKYLDRLRKKYKVQFNDDANEIIITQYQSPGLNSSVTREDTSTVSGKNNLPLDNLNESEKKLVVATFRYGGLTISSLAEEIRKYPPHYRPRFKDKMEVQEFLNNRIIPTYLFEQEVKAQNIRSDRSVESRIKNSMENIMINKIQKIQVTDKIDVTDDDLRKYYEDHKEDYKHPEKREIQQIYVKDNKLAENLVKRARRGEDFNKLFRRYNEKETLKNNEGKSEITRGHAGIGKPSFQTNAGEIADPVKIGDGFFVIKVLNIKEPVLQTFDEAKSLISTKVRRLFIENREQEWIDDLRKQINHVIYEKNLEKAYQQIGEKYIQFDK